jgi:hypothetical protein
MDQDTLEYLKSLGISVARGVPQLATGFVDLAALPFTLSGLIKPEQAVGSTDWMTAKGYLPPKQEGLLNETTELLSGVVNPATALKTGLLGIGATAFHGTPHKIKGAFDIGKVGTGEGAQAYGHGMYFAESPNVAKQYQTDRSYVGKILSGQNANVNFDAQKIAQDALNIHGSNAKSHLEGVLKLNQTSKNVRQIEENKKLQDAINFIEIGNLQKQGNLYKVDIPDAAIPMMLDYDSPIKNQPQLYEIVRQSITDPDIRKTFEFNAEKGITGANVYKNYIGGKTDAERSANAAKLGITGIRYLDEGSRSTGKGTSNYVVFEPSTVKILEENGINVDELLKSGLLGN